MTKKEQYRPDFAAQNAVWVHVASFTDLSCLVEDVENGEFAGEICCSRPADPIYFANGSYGVYLKGEVTAMFTEDIGSLYDKVTGQRYTSDNDWDEFAIKEYDKLKPSQSIDDFKYTESWVIPTKIVGAWIYKSTATQKRIDRLESLGLSVTILEDR